jgi:hypothetical protein
LFRALKEAGVEGFSYDEFWEEQEKKELTQEEKHRRLLREQLNEASRRTRLDPQIRYDLFNLIDGDKEGFRQETINWLKQFSSKGIPKAWKDDIAKFLAEKAREID